MIRVVLVSALLIGCAGCHLAPAVVGAGLGFATSAAKLDDDLLIWYLQQKGSLPPAAPSPAAPAPVP